MPLQNGVENRFIRVHGSLRPAPAQESPRLHPPHVRTRRSMWLPPPPTDPMCVSLLHKARRLHRLSTGRHLVISTPELGLGDRLAGVAGAFVYAVATGRAPWLDWPEVASFAAVLPLNGSKLWLPWLPAEDAHKLSAALQVPAHKARSLLRRLRSPAGCPWSQSQLAATLGESQRKNGLANISEAVRLGWFNRSSLSSSTVDVEVISFVNECLDIRSTANQRELATWGRVLMMSGNRAADLRLMQQALRPRSGDMSGPLVSAERALRLQGCILSAVLSPSLILLHSAVRLIEVSDGQVFHSRVTLSDLIVEMHDGTSLSIVIHHRIPDKVMRSQWVQWAAVAGWPRDAARARLIGNVSAAQASGRLLSNVRLSIAPVMDGLVRKAHSASRTVRCIVATNSLVEAMLMEVGGTLPGCTLLQAQDLSSSLASTPHISDSAQKSKASRTGALTATLVDWHLMRSADVLFNPQGSGLSFSAAISATRSSGLVFDTDSGRRLELNSRCSPRFC